MARVTRSQTQPTAADRQESQGAAASTGKKRKQSANKDEPVSKRPKAVQPKTNGTKSQVPPKKKAVDTTTSSDTKSVEELKELRNGPVPDLNPDAPPRDPSDEPMYWLLKSEPEVRVEDGYEIKFSIDDLAAKATPEGWEGIRAYAARNNLRQMRKGDRAFFYHSNCKEPGVVGTMLITKEWSPDWSACINDNPYYDAKAPQDGSRWSLVHVKIEHKFPRIVPLKMLKEQGDSGPLANMQLLKQSRLSVSKVNQEEWDEILRLAQGLAEKDTWVKSVEETKLLPNYSAT